MLILFLAVRGYFLQEPRLFLLLKNKSFKNALARAAPLKQVLKSTIFAGPDTFTASMFESVIQNVTLFKLYLVNDNLYMLINL